MYTKKGFEKIDVISSQHELEIDKTQKKDFGIFYTDYSLAYNMIKEIDIKKDSIILDPCCGTGVFLIAAKKLGYNKIYGCDIDNNAIKMCNANAINAKKCDTIFNDVKNVLNVLNLNKNVDCIIGNPPYAVLNNNNCKCIDKRIFDEIKNNGNNLFIGSIIQSINMLNPYGILSYIIPKNFLHVESYKNLRKYILKKFDILEIVDIGAHFKNVRGEQIIFTMQNCKSNSNKIKFKTLNNNKFEFLSSIPQNFYSNEIVIFKSNQDYIVYKKLNKSKDTLQQFKKIEIHRGHSKSKKAIKGRDIRKYGFKNNMPVNNGNQLFIQNIYSAESGSIATFAGNMEAGETITVLTSENKDECKLILAFLHSSIWNLYLYKFCYNSSKLTMHTDAKYLFRIPMPENSILNKYLRRILNLVDKIENEEYMSNNWFNVYRELDNTIYSAYGMNKYDTLYISSEINKIQSKRWIS